MSRKLFVTGTGTDVGKTFVTGLILKKLNQNGRKAAYYKAAMSGNDRREDGSLIPGDALFVKNVSGIQQPLEEMCPYIYENAVSPHLASVIEGDPVDFDRVMRGFYDAEEKYDFVTAEGSGGILCPIRYDDKKIMLEDIIRAMDAPCVIVADAGLGTINSVVLTYKYMESAGISVKGIIFNHYHKGDLMEEDNLKMCQELTGLKVIACVPDDAEDIGTDAEMLESLYE